MVRLEKNFISVVVLGDQNPQILNANWLKEYEIIDIQREPFKSFFEKEEKQFTKYVSTPPFTNLAFDNIEFIIDENRFQVRDSKISEWSDTQILDITEKYYNILMHTPLRVIGINLNTRISFEDNSEAGKFNNIFLPKNALVYKILNVENLQFNSTYSYGLENLGVRGQFTVSYTNNPLVRNINLNYEFNCKEANKVGICLSKFSELIENYNNIADNIIKGI